VASISGDIVTILKAGSTTITASQAGNGSYSAAASVAQVLTVNNAATTTTLSTSGTPSIYGGSVTLTATVAPTIGGGTVQFYDNAVALGSPVALSSGQAQLASSALVTGSHSITATYSGTTNYNGSTASALTQTVNKATPTVPTAPTASDIVYGQTLASSTLSGGAGSVAGGFAFTMPTTAPAAGMASQGVTFTPTDTANYQTATTNVNVTVTKATPTVPTAPTASDIVVGQTLASSVLSGGAGSVAGSFAFTTPTTAPAAGMASQGVTFTPTDTANYQTATTSVNVTVTALSYASWATDPAQGLTAGVNDGPLDDPDHDGVANLLEFTLGGAPMVSSQSVMPKLASLGGNWVFEYDRNDASIAPATIQVVEYGSDLAGWTPVTIPTTSGGVVTITDGSSSDHVKVTLPAGGNQVFVRLKVSQQ
jgi:hypothetical protein